MDAISITRDWRDRRLERIILIDPDIKILTRGYVEVFNPPKNNIIANFYFSIEEDEKRLRSLVHESDNPDE